MNESKYEALLQAASKKLGTTPEKLRSALGSGDLAALSANLSREDKEKLRAVLANKALMQRLKNASAPEDIIKILNNNG